MSEKIESEEEPHGAHNDGKFGKVGERLKRLAMAIMLLASVAIAVVYFAGAGQVRSDPRQRKGEAFDQQVKADARRWFSISKETLPSIN